MVWCGLDSKLLEHLLYTGYVAGKRLQTKPFLVEVLDCVYRLCRAPPSYDAVVGGRDLGGVYTELTMGSAISLTEELAEANIIQDGFLVQENGSGLNTMACHFALWYNCNVVGVEIQPELQDQT